MKGTKGTHVDAKMDRLKRRECMKTDEGQIKEGKTQEWNWEQKNAWLENAGVKISGGNLRGGKRRRKSYRNAKLCFRVRQSRISCIVMQQVIVIISSFMKCNRAFVIKKNIQR